MYLVNCRRECVAVNERRCGPKALNRVLRHAETTKTLPNITKNFRKPASAKSKTGDALQQGMIAVLTPSCRQSASLLLSSIISISGP